MTILLGITGLILIYLEFFFPGAVLGVGGGLMLIASLVLYFFQAPHAAAFFVYAAICAIALPLTIYLAIHRLRRSKLSLNTDQEGYQASGYPKELIGQIAMTTSDLKPSGYVEINGQSFSALSKLGYIDRGTHVRIIGGQGNHFIVKQENTHYVSHSNG